MNGLSGMKRTLMVLIAVAMTAAACGQSVFALEVGQCFNDPSSTEEVSSVSTVDCAEPHNNEVFHLS